METPSKSLKSHYVLPHKTYIYTDITQLELEMELKKAKQKNKMKLNKIKLQTYLLKTSGWPETHVMSPNTHTNKQTNTNKHVRAHAPHDTLPLITTFIHHIIANYETAPILSRYIIHSSHS